MEPYAMNRDPAEVIRHAAERPNARRYAGNRRLWASRAMLTKERCVGRGKKPGGTRYREAPPVVALVV